ncbi:integrase/recombinase XerD [Paenibacillus tianmuensis]|uniref:Integrase/recombinase XerD n=1 Tax=Paenibacillus tianmuensis TaxID=624147 RepID=A0A1G4TUM0_9BACL|nr:integrase/recombinase XerD [Paenibacillus tianmuensis]
MRKILTKYLEEARSYTKSFTTQVRHFLLTWLKKQGNYFY